MWYFSPVSNKMYRRDYLKCMKSEKVSLCVFSNGPLIFITYDWSEHRYNHSKNEAIPIYKLLKWHTLKWQRCPYTILPFFNILCSYKSHKLNNCILGVLAILCHSVCSLLKVSLLPCLSYGQRQHKANNNKVK